MLNKMITCVIAWKIDKLLIKMLILGNLLEHTRAFFGYPVISSELNDSFKSWLPSAERPPPKKDLVCTVLVNYQEFIFYLYFGYPSIYNKNKDIIC